MGPDRSLLGSRVARRTLTAFVVACLIPLGVTGGLAFLQVGATLEKRAFGDLEEASRSIGQQILDRLLIAHGALEQVAARSDASNADIIDAAYRETAGGVEPVRGELEVVSDHTHVATGKPELLVRRIGAAAEVLLAIPSGDGFVVGRIDDAYIWETANLLPYGLELCAFAFGHAEPLFCTHQLPDGGKHAMLASSGTAAGLTFSWESREQEYLSSQWELFLPSRFVTRPWTIVVSQSRDLALESLTAFNRAFLQALAVSIVVIFLLSIRQIRRILGPLAELVAGTRQIARREFSTRVELRGGDEFSELADAMNDMAKRLGQQFEALTTLGEIDHLILSAFSIEEVFEVLLRRVSKITPDCELSMLLIDPDERERGRLYTARFSGKRDPGGQEGLRSEISAEGRAWLSDAARCRVATTAELRSYLGLTSFGDDAEFAVFPFFRGSELRGALLARLPGAVAGNDPEVVLLGEFAGRLSVAVGAADREQELFNRAHFDALTGLPNRRLCYDRLGQAIARARGEGLELAVLFIDLDGFKHVNDSLGHSLGDELLRQTALRISGSLRETDTLARLGGDEYVVILPHIHGVLEAETIAETIIEALKQPFLVGTNKAFVGASVGVTVYPEDGQTVEELLRKADTAMYTAKADGRARCVFFSDDMDRRAHERLALQTDLRTALDEGQLRLEYQPQVDFQSGDLVCAEALLRWTHPSRGTVPPSVFIPALEETGLIERVHVWVLETALTDLARWRAQGVQIGAVSVNMVARQLFSDHFARDVMEIIARKGLAGRDLELELTESSVAADFAKTNEVFRQLRDGGVRVAIDDFGTGYSSLVYLHDLMFDTLKIDRAFVAGLPHRTSVAIIEAVVTVAHALGKRVVAEGVEHEAQEQLLKDLGCDIGQGYLFARPADATHFLGWLGRYASPGTEKRVAGRAS